jgi:hypothetical protein
MSFICGPGSVVGIATGYGLGGPGIESRWGQNFPHLYRQALGPTQPPCIMGTGSFPGVKSGRGVTLTPHPLLVPWSIKVELHLYSPYRAVRPVQNLSACTEPQCLYRTSETVQSLSVCTEPQCLYRASVPVQVCTLHFMSFI